VTPRSGVLGAQILAQFAALVRAQAGLVIDPARHDVLAGLVHDRIAHLELADPAAYLERVGRDPAERQTLVEGLTIGETYFARIPPQIRALQQLVLPTLLARPERRLRIWSAGCSTGEEPYTLALLLAKLLPADGRGYDVRIIGTDISARALLTAREGRYSARSVGLLSDADLARYFVRDGDSWRVGPELRSMVEFRQHNLVTDPPPEQPLDLVLCRNVLIYFDRPQMLAVVDAMHGALIPGGWLLLGHSETLWRLYDGFGLVRHEDAFLYRRGASEPAAPHLIPPHLIPQHLIPQPAKRAARAQPAATTIPAPEPDLEALVGEVREALGAGAYAMAAELAAALLEKQPLAADIHYLQGLALVELGEDGPALLALRRAAYLDPTCGFAQFLLGLVLGRLGHGAEAARAYGAAARSLSRLEPSLRVSELGGRRVGDLADMCRQLATTRQPIGVGSPPAEDSWR
jgi:chemotaxis protein methyltransferase CheR